MVSEVFLTLLVTSGVALLGVALRICYKSKCSSIECGCLKIKRDTGVEEREDALQLQHQIHNTPTHSGSALNLSVV